MNCLISDFWPYSSLDIMKKNPLQHIGKIAFQELFKIPMCWVNTTVFDFKNQLRTGCMTLYMWNCDDEEEDFICSLGTVVSNTGDDPVALTVTFHK